MRGCWKAEALGNLCDVLDSQRKPITKRDRRPGEYPYYGATGIQDYVDGFLFDEPLVLVGEDGAKWGVGESTAFAVEGKCWVNNHAHVLRPHRSRLIDNWLIHYFFYSDLSQFVSGLTVPKLTQGSLREIPIPLPPVAEQRRIVSILDEAFDGVATAKANAEKNLQNARALSDGYLQTVFASRGREWTDQAFGLLAEFRNGVNFTKSSRGETIPILGVRNFQNYFWAPLDVLDSVTVQGEFSEADALRENDLVFVRSNGNVELIGRCVLVGPVKERIAHSGFTIRARLQEQGLYPKYICHFLKSSVARRKMIDSGIGTNIKSLSQGVLADLVIPVPPIDEQRKIVERLEQFSDEGQHLESIYQRKLAALDELKQSLLHHAFSGAL